MLSVSTFSTGWPKKSKPLPNDQKIVLNRIKASLRLDLFAKLKYESSTIILFVGVRYSLRGLLSDPNLCLICKLSICVRNGK